MDDALAWAAAPAAAAPDPAPTPAGMQAVALTGAITLCEQVHVDYTTLDPAARAHYQHIAVRVFLDMWDAAIEQNLTVAVEHVDADGTPIPQEPRP